MPIFIIYRLKANMTFYGIFSNISDSIQASLNATWLRWRPLKPPNSWEKQATPVNLRLNRETEVLAKTYIKKYNKDTKCSSYQIWLPFVLHSPSIVSQVVHKHMQNRGERQKYLLHNMYLKLLSQNYRRR